MKKRHNRVIAAAAISTTMRILASFQIKSFVIFIHSSSLSTPVCKSVFFQQKKRFNVKLLLADVSGGGYIRRMAPKKKKKRN